MTEPNKLNADYALNPITGRVICKTSATYLKMVKLGYIKDEAASAHIANVEKQKKERLLQVRNASIQPTIAPPDVPPPQPETQPMQPEPSVTQPVTKPPKAKKQSKTSTTDHDIRAIARDVYIENKLMLDGLNREDFQKMLKSLVDAKLATQSIVPSTPSTAPIAIVLKTKKRPGIKVMPPISTQSLEVATDSVE